jgi:hypothetical protein
LIHDCSEVSVSPLYSFPCSLWFSSPCNVSEEHLMGPSMCLSALCSNSSELGGHLFFIMLLLVLLYLFCCESYCYSYCYSH